MWRFVIFSPESCTTDAIEGSCDVLTDRATFTSLAALVFFGSRLPFGVLLIGAIGAVACKLLNEFVSRHYYDLIGAVYFIIFITFGAAAVTTLALQAACEAQGTGFYVPGLLFT